MVEKSKRKPRGLFALFAGVLTGFVGVSIFISSRIVFPAASSLLVPPAKSILSSKNKNRRKLTTLDMAAFPNPTGECPKVAAPKDWDSPVRAKRFPSVEERVCQAMTVWYDPHYQPDDKASGYIPRYSYRYVPEEDGTNWKRLALRVKDNEQTFPNSIKPDVVFHVLMEEEEDILKDLSHNDLGITDQSGNKLNMHLTKVELEALRSAPINDRIELRPNLWSYGVDFEKMLDILKSHHKYPPLLALFGDREARLEIPVPLIAKWRYHNPAMHRSATVPIIWKLESERHYNTPFPEVKEYDIEWSHKRNIAIYRGMFSGHNYKDNMLAEEYLNPDSGLHLDQACEKVQRCKLVFKYYASPLIDAKLTYAFFKFDKINGRDMVAQPNLEIKDMLQYKMIISMEGNDVATGLKWMLLSKSVVLMPPPTKTTYALEHYLEPWVHYIPLDPNVQNVEEQVQWVLDHDEEAKRISERATNFINDLFFHPDAAREERLVGEQIALRYASLWKDAGATRTTNNQLRQQQQQSAPPDATATV